MTNQQELWDKKHGAGDHEKWNGVPRLLAVTAAGEISEGAGILELGCGTGSDARYFAGKGFIVTATDFSQVVIEQNRARNTLHNLSYETLDITDRFPYPDAAFDVVYSYLSLHYFDVPTTKQIFSEISRVLKPAGQLFFTCKSLNDLQYGRGEEIGADTFQQNGHTRHFFSEAYIREVVPPTFDIISTDESSFGSGDQKSAFINCYARKLDT